MESSSSHAYLVQAIRDVHQTITEKCQVLGDVLATSRDKFHSMESAGRDRVFQHTHLVDDMNHVFDQLRTTRVPSSDKTLFDFVDADTVQALQQDAIEQTRELEEMLSMHRHALVRIHAIYKFFCSFEREYGPSVHEVVAKDAGPSPHRQDLPTLDRVYDSAVRFFVDMEQCDRSLLQYFTTINDVYSQS
ncbi:hypothetical protein PINS_up013179 [Pythium insidiosum]|nr:hypothetical protein PINS_up013179 [Pythium insidiosum]